MPRAKRAPATIYKEVKYDWPESPIELTIFQAANYGVKYVIEAAMDGLTWKEGIGNIKDDSEN